MLHVNRKKEKFFLNLVKKGILHVSKRGIVTNTITGTKYGTKKNGKYQRVVFYDIKQHKNVTFKLHRLVFLVHVGPIPDGFEPNHKDGVKHNNRLSNLELVTRAQNVQHAHAMGLTNPTRGEDSGVAKLNEIKVRKIFKLRQAGYTYERLAKKFNVTCVNIRFICLGKTWSHVDGYPGKISVKHKKQGSNNGRSLINEDDVRYIRRVHNKSKTTRQLADKYNLSMVSIQRISRKISWRHVA